MTVAKLIEKLKQFPDDMPVYRDDHTWSAILVSHVSEVTPQPEFFTGLNRKPGVIVK